MAATKTTSAEALKRMLAHIDAATDMYLDGEVTLGELVGAMECAKLEASHVAHDMLVGNVDAAYCFCSKRRHAKGGDGVEA